MLDIFVFYVSRVVPKATKQPDNATQGKLTDKQKLFIAEYITSWNATRAALKAGYSEKTAKQMGTENLAKPTIRAAIDEKLKALTLGADEVLMRLSQHATGSLMDFLDLETGDVNITTEEARQKFHLVKKIKRTRHTSKDGYESVTTEIELHDPQSALVQLGRYHKLFTDKQEHKLDDAQFDQLKQAKSILEDKLNSIIQRTTQEGQS